MKYYKLNYAAWQIIIVVLYRMKQKDNEVYVSKLSRNIGRISDLIYKYINSFESQGIIITKHKNRCKYIEFTDKGKIIAINLDILINEQIVNDYVKGDYFGE